MEKISQLEKKRNRKKRKEFKKKEEKNDEKNKEKIWTSLIKNRKRE